MRDPFKVAMGSAIKAIGAKAEWIGHSTVIPIEGAVEYNPKKVRMVETDADLSGLGDWIFYTQFSLKRGDYLRIEDQLFVVRAVEHDGAGTNEAFLDRVVEINRNEGSRI